MKLFFICLLNLFFASVGWGGYPEKIVSLAPSITKNLYLLGAEDKIIGVTIYCPKQAKDKEKIGTVLEPNIEKIIQLKPDLVIATKEGNRLKTVKKLEDLGLKVFVMESHNSFSDICKGFLELGRLSNKKEKAKNIILNAEKRISKIQNISKKLKNPTIFWEIGTNPLFTASKNTFINDFIEFSGGTNIFKDLKVRYPQVSREEVIHRDPDVIIIVNMGYVTNEEKKLWQNFKHLKAVKNKRIYILNDTIFNEPTPDSFASGVEIVANLLHGKDK